MLTLSRLTGRALGQRAEHEAKSHLIQFGTKAETLSRLYPRVGPATVLPCFVVTAKEWQEDAEVCLNRLAGALERGAAGPLIVRSSARTEDTNSASMAGAFRSITQVNGATGVRDAVNAVLASYGEVRADDQVLLQPMLQQIAVSGVAFSCEPSTGMPYIIVNYDDTTGDTSSVTNGRTADLKTYIHVKSGPATAPGFLAEIVTLVSELERAFGRDCLDIEFAIDQAGTLFLLQVRPLVVSGLPRSATAHQSLLNDISQKISTGMRPHPYLFGSRTVYGVMPDWNPAEIIGIRPRPLALSLYRDLVTDSIWAYQRNNYGYKNLRSFPLMLNFYGLPYIDVRVSINSFIPRDIESSLAERLANHYIDRLIKDPALHDKIEFEIVFSCYTLDIRERARSLTNIGVSASDTSILLESLRKLTNRIIHPDQGLWREDSCRIEILSQRREQLLKSDLDDVGRIYWLLEDCKRYGTLPFAGLARAGFIAVQMLKSLVTVGVLTEHEYNHFMNELNTVSSQMTRDLAQLDRGAFLSKYGHLRPGTYDILSPRYDEAPDYYFDWDNRAPVESVRREPFSLTLLQMRQIVDLLTEHRLEHDVMGLMGFIQSAIELREYSKFLFTRNLSDALSLIRRYGERHGFSAEELSYADCLIFHDLNAASLDPREIIGRSIAEGKALYEKTQQIMLPPLITSPDDVWGFHMPPSEPNFITQKNVTARVCGHADVKNLKGAIVAIENADPGFDWLFSHSIAGFITAYGGANSHMAIRANELGLPAIIGAGEVLYRKWSSAQMLRIDCDNHRVDILR